MANQQVGHARSGLARVSGINKQQSRVQSQVKPMKAQFRSVHSCLLRALLSDHFLLIRFWQQTRPDFLKSPTLPPPPSFIHPSTSHQLEPHPSTNQPHPSSAMARTKQTARKSPSSSQSPSSIIFVHARRRRRRRRCIHEDAGHRRHFTSPPHMTSTT